MRPRKIFIGGDSWGCGEWSTKGVVDHKGLEQYFSDAGYTVVNSSKGGSSNNDSIDRLDLSLSSFRTNDIIFWLQTDSVRDLRPFTQLTQDIINVGGLDVLILNTLRNSYYKLNVIAERLNTPIHMIGGMHDLNVNELKNFANLNPIMPSWVNLLVGTAPEYKELFPQHRLTDSVISFINKKIMPTQLFYQTIDILYAMDQCLLMYKEKIFHPDGAHPNRQGHQTLFHYLVQELKL